MNAPRSTVVSFCAVVAAMSFSPLWGQSQPPRLPTDKTPPPATNLTEYRNALGTARTLAKANNVAAAEQALVALNRTKAGTSGWHRESASRLVQLAGDLSREAAPSAARSLAGKAQEHLAQAIRLARTPQERGQAHAALGFIHERYNGNLTAAIASYQAAVEAMPKSASAQESLARLQLIEKAQQNRAMATKR